MFYFYNVNCFCCLNVFSIIYRKTNIKTQNNIMYNLVFISNDELFVLSKQLILIIYILTFFYLAV